MSGDDKHFILDDQKWKSVSLWLILQPHFVKLQDGCIVVLKPHRDASCTLSLVHFVHRANAVTQSNEKPSAEVCACLLQRLLFFFFLTHIRANWPNSIPKSKQKSTKNWKAKLKERRKMSSVVTARKALGCLWQSGPCLIAKSGQEVLLFIPSHSSDCNLRLL